MEFEVGKIYEVQLGPKNKYSHIKARYIEYRSEEDSHVIEMLSTIKWNGSATTLALQKQFMEKSGHGIHYIVETEQILKEVDNMELWKKDLSNEWKWRTKDMSNLSYGEAIKRVEERGYKYRGKIQEAIDDLYPVGHELVYIDIVDETIGQAAKKQKEER